MGCLSKKGQYPSTGSPTYQIIKVPNANHMSVMKTSLTIIPMCPRERFSHYKKLSRPVLCYKKDWATLLHFVYFLCLLPVTNYLITKLSITYNFSACREHLTKNRFLSFPSAPCWVRHSYLSKGLRYIPYTCGSSRLFSGTVAGECSAIGGNLVRKHLYSVLKFSVTCHYGN